MATDRECLEAWRRKPESRTLQPLVERYLAFVYSSAYRRTGNASHAEEVTRAVFLVLARRAKRLRKKTVLPGWLFHVTAVACRKLVGKPKRPGGWLWFGRRKNSALPPEAPLWVRVTPEIDAAIDRLSAIQRDAVLLRVMMGRDWEIVTKILRTNERRAGKRVDRGLKALTRRLRKQGVTVDVATLEQVCSAESCSTPVPESLTVEILTAIETSLGRKPSFQLARRTLSTMAWARWRRRFAIAIPSFVLVMAIVAGTAWHIDSRTGHSRLISMFLVWSVKNEGRTVPGLAQPAQSWPSVVASVPPIAAGIRDAQDLYQTTNIWLAHLKFTREQWSTLQPERIDPLPHFLQPDGTALLRNPAAQRSGLAGALGFDFNWTHADIEFGNVTFTNVAARIKGNGTFLASLYGDKRPFKMDLNKFNKGQKLGDTDELTFNNLLNDYSCLSDALAYEFFRQAGVPASRTAYAFLSVSVEDQWEKKPLGLYVMVESVEEEFALEWFGSERTPIFKPVTYELFNDLGDDWAAYEAIYDLKTKATPAQLQRVIKFAKLVTDAEPGEFAEKLEEFLDLEAFARYLACEVLLSNYDGFLSNGQNFHLYLHPASNKFGFIPWDLDLSWGGFFLLGTTRERERASIWHPWVGEHRFLERAMAVGKFRELYRAQLEDLSTRLFVPDRLHQRIDEVAEVIRSPIAAESEFRLGKFEQAISDQRIERSPGRNQQGANRPAHQIKRFITARAKSVREQLDGKSEGVIMERRGHR